MKFTACDCESLVSTMTRARLWPSSPHRPEFGFSFELLDWAEALLLEAQVSLHDFCKAVNFKCQSVVNKVVILCYLVLKFSYFDIFIQHKNFYSVLIDCFEEYRWMKVELQHLSGFFQNLDSGNVCPACPKVHPCFLFS